jgi:hypothetical protein
MYRLHSAEVYSILIKTGQPNKLRMVWQTKEVAPAGIPKLLSMVEKLAAASEN